MKQAALFELPPVLKNICFHALCGEGLIPSEPQDFGTCINIDYTCPVHGKQFTESTRKGEL